MPRGPLFCPGGDFGDGWGTAATGVDGRGWAQLRTTV